MAAADNSAATPASDIEFLFPIFIIFFDNDNAVKEYSIVDNGILIACIVAN